LRSFFSLLFEEKVEMEVMMGCLSLCPPFLLPFSFLPSHASKPVSQPNKTPTTRYETGRHVNPHFIVTFILILTRPHSFYPLPDRIAITVLLHSPRPTS